MFAERRNQLLSAMGPDAVAIIPGAGIVQRSNDTTYRFRQDSDFWYLTGFEHADATAILSTLPGRPAYTLFVQPRDPVAEVWTGYRPASRNRGGEHSPIPRPRSPAGTRPEAD